MQPNVLIFDLDGVLVDVTDSYRRAVSETVKFFTGRDISNEEIQALKNRGGSNNDWDLSLEIVRSLGGNPSREEVIAAFQKLYLGENCDGLIARERWLPHNGLLERLSSRYQMAMFTGRENWEARFTLSKFAPAIRIDPVIGMEDVQREKPDPEGLLKIVDQIRPGQAYYIGDATDDCRAAKAAKMPFIGVVSTHNPLRADLEALFRGEGATAVISDINELEAALP